jgi:single-strand selective monofunctional uracil DNA glycosylase
VGSAKEAAPRLSPSANAEALIAASRVLGARVDRLRFGAPVAYVYNPLAYAAPLHEAYLARYGAGPKEVLFLGMNPGPFGMAQTGVPFGDVSIVRDWLGLSGTVGRPSREHPKRPVLGLECPRGEVSGQRLWGWARDRFGSPERFFDRFFVVNYCPLVFVEESGRNFTPDKLSVAERTRLFAACDDALAATIDALEPSLVVGVGAFAAARARAVIDARGRSAVRSGTILHPSPASPAANRGWARDMEAQLQGLGVTLP